MATRDQRQTFMPSSNEPAKETPPVSPRGARIRSATSSSRRAPSVPLAQLTKKFIWESTVDSQKSTAPESTAGEVDGPEESSGGGIRAIGFRDRRLRTVDCRLSTVDS